MPVFLGLLAEKALAAAFYAVVAAVVAVTGAGAYQLGRGLSTAAIGAHEQSRAAREAADASPQRLQELQRIEKEGQLKQHQGLYDAVDGVADFSGGAKDAMEKAIAEEDAAAAALPDIGDFALDLRGPDEAIVPGEPLPVTVVARNAGQPVTVDFAVVAGAATLDVQRLDLSTSNPPSACDPVGKELVCGINVTLEKAEPAEVEARFAGRKVRLRLEPQCVTGAPRLMEAVEDDTVVVKSEFRLCFPKEQGGIRGSLALEITDTDADCSGRLTYVATLAGDYAPPAITGQAQVTVTLHVVGKCERSLIPAGTTTLTVSSPLRGSVQGRTMRLAIIDPEDGTEAIVLEGPFRPSSQ